LTPETKRGRELVNTPWDGFPSLLWVMCGRRPIGKIFFDVGAALAGAVMCAACASFSSRTARFLTSSGVIMMHSGFVATLVTMIHQSPNKLSRLWVTCGRRHGKNFLTLMQS
jgi:hypothetical protein